jgi:hypothetical protein
MESLYLEGTEALVAILGTPSLSGHSHHMLTWQVDFSWRWALRNTEQSHKTRGINIKEIP